MTHGSAAGLQGRLQAPSLRRPVPARSVLLPDALLHPRGVGAARPGGPEEGAQPGRGLRSALALRGSSELDQGWCAEGQMATRHWGCPGRGGGQRCAAPRRCRHAGRRTCTRVPSVHPTHPDSSGLPYTLFVKIRAHSIWPSSLAQVYGSLHVCTGECDAPCRGGGSHDDGRWDSAGVQAQTKRGA